MISLKKYLEQEADERLPVTFTAFRRTLSAIASNSQKSCPAPGADLKAALDPLVLRLVPDITPAALRRVGKDAEHHLSRWGSASAEYLKTKAAEMKEMLLLISQTANAFSQRDERYAASFSELTSRLQTISQLDDLTKIRASLTRSVAELTSCVQRMVQEGEESVARLKTEIAGYQSRLQETEQVASRDALTGVFNRRRLEDAMNYRIHEQQPFSWVMLDLENFKAVNDHFGHVAGDNLLKQFAYELRCSARTDDVVGRWGGDEFVVILDSDLEEARAMMDRMQHWFSGDYSIPDPSGAYEVTLSASIGVAQWQPGETLQELVARADRALLQQKHLHARSSPPAI